MGATCAGNLKPSGSGTRLTLWTRINRGFVSMGAAGWHISFDVLDYLLSGTPIGRIAGADAMKFAGWQRLNAEYAKQFGVKRLTGRLRRVRSRESMGSQKHSATRTAEKTIMKSYATFDFSLDSHPLCHSDPRLYLQPV